ncbi:ArnT family glycosyltransferase [Maridesulfovibrio bastinii]|uniref:ArnT family glycosyltransferase n=1 Tax=Maridesulfovibrio bastinii TaxID=47157 RepID=UPI0004174A34|nr:glycosyltransferase family 39 protein [Maridesulfovibrio bastinii]
MRNDSASGIWNILERHPWITLFIIMAVQSMFALDYRALWFSDEVRHADVYHQMINAGHWIVLHLNGVPYPDKPPVYFWFLYLLDSIVPIGEPGLFFLGSAISALIFLFSTVALAKTLGFNRKTTFASGMVLVTNIFFVGIAHYSRMDLMFSSMIIWANICFFKSFETENNRKWIISAFIIMGVATLTKGPLGLIFPLLTSFVYLIWKGRISALKNKAFLKGLLILIAILLVWIIGAVITDGTAFIHNIFYKQIYERAVSSFHHEEPWQYYFIALPLAWLPWTMAIFSVPLHRLLSIGHWYDILKSRKNSATNGRDWAWIMLISGFILLSCLSIKVLIYIMPLFAPLSILTARGLMEDENGKTGINSRRIWVCVGCIYLLLAVAAPFAEIFLPFKTHIKGLGFTTLILGVGGVLMLRCRNKGVRTGLLIMALTMTVWIQPLAKITLPSMDNLMSPKQTGEIIREYHEKGYYPLAHKMYSGIFSYYAGTNIKEISDYQKIDDILNNKEKVILVMQKKYYDRWKDKPAGIKVIHEQFISDRPYVLIVKE